MKVELYMYSVKSSSLLPFELLRSSALNLGKAGDILLKLRPGITSASLAEFFNVLVSRTNISHHNALNIAPEFL